MNFTRRAGVPAPSGWTRHQAPDPAQPAGAGGARRREPGDAPRHCPACGAESDEMAAVVAPLVESLQRASRRILRDDALADDATQEALLAYWARPERPENPRAWLLHAVTLRSLHLARSGRRRREHERRASLGRAEGSRRDDPARSLDHADLLRTLEEALTRVPDEYQAVFRLWTFEELDYAAIADLLQIPVGTVRSRLNRGRRALRESLAGALGRVEP